MSSQVFPTFPVQYIPSLPPQYCVISRESLAPVSNLNELSQSQLPVPSIKEFLEKVDKDEDLKDDEFQILAIGWCKTIQAAAKQYG
ncbi:unnamed protein product [Rhizophagus irregularis]|nr:unnamed protein product [Rhizophagus irregularis]